MDTEKVMELFRDCVQAFTTQSPNIFCDKDPDKGEIIEKVKGEWVVNDDHPVWSEHPVLEGTLHAIIDAFISELPHLGSGEDARNSFIKRVRLIIAQRLSNWLGTLTHEIDMDLLCALATEKYESALGDGLHMTLVPYPLEPDYVDGLIPFDRSAWIRLSYPNIHAMRKYLNMGKTARLIVCYIEEPEKYGMQECGFYAIGLAPRKVDAKFPCISFKNMEWQFCLPSKTNSGDLNCWVRCIQGRLFLPLLNQDAYNAREIRRVLEVHKNADFEKNVCNVSELVRQIKEQKKGALLIVAEKSIIEDETRRLCRKGCGIQLSSPLNLRTSSPELLMELTAIDGAAFVDFDLNVHACGAILDGGASKGDMARGSRFNSTKSYLHILRDNHSERALLGIVVSEDGMVNLLNGTEL